MMSIKNKNKIIAGFLLFAALVFVWILFASGTYESSHIPAYQKKLFNGEVASIDIEVDVEEWQNFLDNIQEKEWLSGNLTINGEVFSDVGIRSKGNSSLSQVAMSDNNRYSLQFKMDYNIKNQTYHGLDVFCVNNMMGDVTYMKDYISYDIMNYIGVAAPLTAYVKVTVNGEDYGFGLLLERYEDAFLERVYNITEGGYLYNVKIQMGQRENFMELGQVPVDPGTQEPPSEFSFELPLEPPSERDGDRTFERGSRDGDMRNIGGRMMGGVGGGSNGGSLVYTDDEISSYSSIFANAVFSKKTTEEDMQRVIAAIKNLNEGTNLEEYWDVDGALRYFAAHTVVVNLDSYVSNMQQNYYLYENNGRVSILPWDYNLAFGAFMNGNVSSIVNFPIDTPVSGTEMEERPLLNVLLEIPEYKEKYHEYLRQIVEGYFDSGLFEATVNELNGKINEYIKNDVSVFYTYEEYEASLPVFIEFGRLRAESITKQLDGTIPQTASGQAADSSTLVDASGIDLSVLGSIGGMGGQGGRDGERGFPDNLPADFQQRGFPEGFQQRVFPDDIPPEDSQEQAPPDNPPEEAQAQVIPDSIPEDVQEFQESEGFPDMFNELPQDAPKDGNFPKPIIIGEPAN